MRIIQENIFKKLNDKLKTKPIDTKEKDKSPNLSGFADASSKGDLTTSKKSSTISPNKSPTDLGRTLTRDQARRASANVDFGPGASNVFHNFMNAAKDIKDEIPNTEIDDEDADYVEMEIKPKHINPDNLPAVIRQDLINVDADKGVLNLTWIKLPHTPGYNLEPVRGVFRPLFKALIDAQLEQIQVCTSFHNGMNNMANMIGYIMKHGKIVDNFSMELKQMVEGMTDIGSQMFNLSPEQYKIEQAYIVEWEGISYLILKENLMGNKNYYIYAGPSKQKSKSISGTSNNKQIGNK